MAKSVIGWNVEGGLNRGEKIRKIVTKLCEVSLSKFMRCKPS